MNPLLLQTLLAPRPEIKGVRKQHFRAEVVKARLCNTVLQIYHKWGSRNLLEDMENGAWRERGAPSWNAGRYLG